MNFVDTHAHLDVTEFDADCAEVIARARQAGVRAIFLPCVDANSIEPIMTLARQWPGYCFPMIGLQPEEVRADYREVLAMMKERLDANLKATASPANDEKVEPRYIAVGEMGLDFYWSREFEREQLTAFEEQVQWSIETRLPLMIHCRKAQNEMLAILRPYADVLPGGVFHCFTGNTKEAEAFLQLPRFCLGVGGVSTFKSSHLRDDLPAAVPLDRLVVETDSPYMAPVPHRGKRNESAFAAEVVNVLAQSYGVSTDEFCRITNENVERVFGVKID